MGTETDSIPRAQTAPTRSDDLIIRRKAGGVGAEQLVTIPEVVEAGLPDMGGGRNLIWFSATFVDFTVNEPAHGDGETYIASPVGGEFQGGVGNLTGAFFEDHKMYRSVDGAWVEIPLFSGYFNYDRAARHVRYYRNGAWRPFADALEDGTLDPAKLNASADVLAMLGAADAAAVKAILNIQNGSDGASAYEIAVAGGFVGDEAAWLASLQGNDGNDGTDGVGVPAGGTASQVLAKLSNSDHDTGWVDPGAGGGGILKGVIILEDRKASGTDGGDSVAAGIVTRNLNTEVADTINRCTLAGNQFTLQAGTYRIRGRCPADRVDQHQALLYDVTGATYYPGETAHTPSTLMTHAEVEAVVTVAGATVFELRHYTTTARIITGLGRAASSGQGEVYSRVSIDVLA